MVQKITLRPPCAECPFRKKSLSGWLGQDTPREVMDVVHGDGPFGYPCHMDVAKVKSLDPFFDPSDTSAAEQCVGAMLHARKTHKSYRDQWRNLATNVLETMVGLSGILGFEFVEHHTRKGGKS